MGERLSDDGAPDRRRRTHPTAVTSGRPRGAVSDPRGPGDLDLDEAGMRELLAAVLRDERSDAEGETRAVAAFRAARDAGAHRARTRRRDDWRPRGERGPARSVKGVLSLFAVSLTLGGVAFATIGSGEPGPEDSREDRRRSTPTHSTPARDDGRASAPASTTTGPTTGPARPEHPLTAADTEAHCRAYERVEGRGHALAATAWKRLTEAAGGADKVAEYCARQQRQGGPVTPSAPGRESVPNDRTPPKPPPAPDAAPTPEARPTDADGQARQSRPDKTTGKQGS
ncbi:hypothetical protein AB0K93_36090 [Streptomyces sp. NPDC052676]|uniref:hypothetical protein n=1 Tax=Streptomyces sp. NPDC052676 TaxID=3154953 RepID=UPI00342B2A54